MRAPEFWQSGKGGAAALLLTPLSWLYGAAVRVRRGLARPGQAPIPLLCIGNAVSGGAGKTPVALDLGRRLGEKNLAIHFITRGYGGTARGPCRIDADTHTADRVGDEPLLLARAAPTWVGADRLAAARAAAAAGATLGVLDDGYQNPTFRKDVSVLVIDGAYGFGNGRLLPAGPLREPLAEALSRAHAVVILGDGEIDEPAVRPWMNPGASVLRAAIVPADAAPNTDQPVIAFAGIGRPGKFFDTLKDTGFTLAGTRSFDDHHRFTDGEIGQLRDLAETAGARLMTTEKDWVRLPLPLRHGIEFLTITLRWEDEGALEAFLEHMYS